jgi:hypothetical protein
MLDGNPAGSIDREQTVELQVEPGHHRLQVNAGRHSSPVREFDAADTTNIIVWPRYLASLLVPTIGLRLELQHR